MEQDFSSVEKAFKYRHNESMEHLAQTAAIQEVRMKDRKGLNGVPGYKRMLSREAEFLLKQVENLFHKPDKTLYNEKVYMLSTIILELERIGVKVIVEGPKNA
jgi:hypothetical protein